MRSASLRWLSAATSSGRSIAAGPPVDFQAGPERATAIAATGATGIVIAIGTAPLESASVVVAEGMDQG